MKTLVELLLFLGEYGNAAGRQIFFLIAKVLSHQKCEVCAINREETSHLCHDPRICLNFCLSCYYYPSVIFILCPFVFSV